MTATAFRYSARGMRLFEAAFLPWRGRRLAGVHLAGARPWIHPLPVVVVANHVSWWDGFLVRDVHRAMAAGDASLHTVMLERELERRPLLRGLGAVGLEPGRPSSFRALLRGLDSVRATEAAPWLSFFPQGRIRPSWSRPLGFRPGVEAVLRRPGNAVVLPVGLHLEPLNDVRPAAFVSVGEPMLPGADRSLPALERAVEAELDRILGFIGVHGESAPAEWPAAQDRLPSPGGVGARIVVMGGGG